METHKADMHNDCLWCKKKGMTKAAFRQHELNCKSRLMTCNFCEATVGRKALPSHQRPGSCAKCQAQLESICLREQHETTCPAVPVPCTWCQGNVPRGTLSTHLAQSCPDALVDCAACGVASPRKMEHVCPAALVPCSLGCPKPVRRSDMAEHWRTECANYVRKCPERACLFQAPRKELGEHKCPVTEAKLIFAPGAQCDARDTKGFWCAATMLQVTPSDVTMHYENWNPKFDEVLCREAPRLAPLRRLSQYGPWVGREVRICGESGWKRARMEEVRGFGVRARDSDGKDTNFYWNNYGDLNLWHMIGVLDESDLVPGMLVSGGVEGDSCATLLIVEHTATELGLRRIDCALELDGKEIDYHLPRKEALLKLRPLHAMK
jgi:hypothetical protein